MMNHLLTLASLPVDRHLRYWRMQDRGRRVWVAFWWDDAGKRHKRTLGPTLPAHLPDVPCQHPEKHPWRVPTTEAEREEARERGRRANALRLVRSNQYKQQHTTEHTG